MGIASLAFRKLLNYEEIYIFNLHKCFDARKASYINFPVGVCISFVVVILSKGYVIVLLIVFEVD